MAIDSYLNCKTRANIILVFTKIEYFKKLKPERGE